MAFKMFDSVGDLFITLYRLFRVRAVRISLPIGVPTNALFIPHLVEGIFF